MQAETAAWVAFANTRATTGAGLVAFASYAAAHPDLCEGNFRQPQPLLRTIEASVRQMGTPVPVDLKGFDAELIALGAEFDQLDAAITETNALLGTTDEEAVRSSAPMAQLPR